MNEDPVDLYFDRLSASDPGPRLQAAIDEARRTASRVKLVEFLEARLKDDVAWIHGDGSWLDNCQECGFGAVGQNSPYSLRRLLAEVESKRAILKLDESEWGQEAGDAYQKAIRLLAQPYAKHPDFKPSWKL